MPQWTLRGYTLALFLWQTGRLFAACSTTIHPGDSIQAAVDCSPSGATFTIQAGTYRLQSIQPKDNDTFNGEPGAILSGAKLLTSFTRQKNYWVAGEQTQQGLKHGVCDSDHPRCDRGEDLFFDDKPLLHVDSLDKVAAGKYFFDYDAHAIYLADDPNGHKVETNVTTAAFSGSANNVTITGLTVEKYANPAQAGAMGDRGTGWIIRNCEVRWNHGAGIHLSTNSQGLNNRIHDNGQEGIHGVGDNILVQNNEVASNNYAGFDRGWEAGGAKLALANGVIFRSNNVHDNKGDGLWTDIGCINVLFEGNTVIDNEDAGISHEIGYDARIIGNTVKGNGTHFFVWLWGPQILVQNSQNVEVSGNTVEVSAKGGNGISLIEQNRGSGSHGPWLTRNNSVHDNKVTYLGAVGASGAVADDGSTDIYASNTFDNNIYYAPNPDGHYWIWKDYLNWTGMRSAGQEQHGQFCPIATGCPPPGQ